jgi:superfamily I DNA/RNA helicase
MIPLDRLDIEQREFIDNSLYKSSNKWIVGFPGSGKSVLLIHILATIRAKEPNAKIHIVFFTHALQQLYITGFYELNITQKNITMGTYIKYEKRPFSCDYILCDEVQDLTAPVLKKMKENASRIIVCGDPNQSIYERDPSTNVRVVNPEEIGGIINANKYPLNTIHRLSKSIVKMISKLLPNMGILQAKNNAKKTNVTGRFIKFEMEEEEVNYIINSAFEAISLPGESVVVLFPTHEDILRFSCQYAKIKNIKNWVMHKNSWGKTDYASFNNHFYKNKLHYIGNGFGNLWKANKEGFLILMTYHSSKGLDFDNVYLPFVNEDANITNETLFMVALTRTKETLFISHTKNSHTYFSAIKDEFTEVPVNADQNDNIFDIDF